MNEQDKFELLPNKPQRPGDKSLVSLPKPLVIFHKKQKY